MLSFSKKAVTAVRSVGRKTMFRMSRSVSASFMILGLMLASTVVILTPSPGFMSSGAPYDEGELINAPKVPVALRELGASKTYTLSIEVDGEETEIWQGDKNPTKNFARLGTLMATDTGDGLVKALTGEEDARVVVSVNEIVYVETYESIPYTVSREASDDITYGEEMVVMVGSAGETRHVYEVELKDGVEISRTEIIRQTVTAPINEQILYGTGNAIITPDGRTLLYERVLEVEATAYSPQCDGGLRTAMGTATRRGVIAVDPKVIPLGSVVYVTSPDGDEWIYGVASCEDTGGAIKGNRIDLFMDSKSEAVQFGRRGALVYVLKESD